jgi:hypothetical protein
MPQREHDIKIFRLMTYIRGASQTRLRKPNKSGTTTQISIRIQCVVYGINHSIMHLEVESHTLCSEKRRDRVECRRLFVQFQTRQIHITVVEHAPRVRQPYEALQAAILLREHLMQSRVRLRENTVKRRKYSMIMSLGFIVQVMDDGMGWHCFFLARF